MKRIKRQKVEREDPSTSSRDIQEHDLAYYIHDRVELMHQVFSLLKLKDLKAMAPECVRNLSIDDLQELCTEELLGISSKRLCAMLDGAEPPSDTESSSRSPSPENFETISLDSISSDEEILSQSSRKKKHKHRRRSSKAKKQKTKDKPPIEDTESNRASRAGLTVLELLELQARARAIRAQLQQEQLHRPISKPNVDSSNSSENEVEIKEEPAEVVEISSDEEKPKIEDLNKEVPQTDKETNGNTKSKKHKNDKDKKNKSKKQKEKNNEEQKREVPKDSGPPKEGVNNVTKIINDLIITVPQQPNRKIKLNRSKFPATVTNIEATVPAEKSSLITETPAEAPKLDSSKQTKEKVKSKKKQKKKDKRLSLDKDASDHDEITLQLSDSEKMDLLEDLDRKNYDSVSSSSSSDSDDSEDDNKGTADNTVEDSKDSDVTADDTVEDSKDNEETADNTVQDSKKDNMDTEDVSEQITEVACQDTVTESVTVISETIQETSVPALEENHDEDMSKEESNAEKGKSPTEMVVEDNYATDIVTAGTSTDSTNVINDNTDVTVDETPVEKDTEIEIKESTKEMSEGELSEQASSEVEAFDLQPEVVTISDEDTGNKTSTKKKKSKKDKKSKKEKKSKKTKSNFREASDQNFFTESNASEIVIDDKLANINTKHLAVDSDDVYEILELSDDSSCYEVEGTVLSKEPTADEIEALSAKIDEIEREDVITDEQIRELERNNEEKLTEGDVENISWKDRYLDSTKVKKVLTTSNLLNAMRKKNIELKQKIEASKNIEVDTVMNLVEKIVDEELEEGTIEQYNTLQASNKYVDPVPDPTQKESEETESTNVIQKKIDIQITGELKKDAKQLLKMYKKLLKYNDMTKQRDPNKKKKKKQKKKDKEKEVVAST